MQCNACSYCSCYQMRGFTLTWHDGHPVLVDVARPHAHLQVVGPQRDRPPLHPERRPPRSHELVGGVRGGRGGGGRGGRGRVRGARHRRLGASSRLRRRGQLRVGANHGNFRSGGRLICHCHNFYLTLVCLFYV